MLQGRAINQRKYAFRYNPVRGRRSVEDVVGPGKILARTFGISSLLGYDPKGEGGFLINNPVERQFDGMQKVAFFLRKFKNTSSDHLKVTHQSGRDYIEIGDDEASRHRFLKRGDAYYLIVKKDYRPKAKNYAYNQIPIKIHAQNHAEFKQKLGWILNKPVSRAKLDYHVPKLIVPAADDLKRSGYGKYVYFNEDKVVGHAEIQEFTDIGDPGISTGFTSEVGGTDNHNINYYAPTVSYRGYSSLDDKDNPVVKIHEQFGARIHGMNEHILSSNVVDELLGNIVNMHHRGKVLSPEHRARVVQDIREDFIYNLYGRGSRNGLANQEGNSDYTPAARFQSFLSQFMLASDPLKGARFWRNTPLSLPQIMAFMYKPKGDGTIEDLYEKDPETYLKNMRQLKMTIGDRQFMGSYGRKMLGIYIALKFIKHELSKLEIDHKNSSQADLKKWRDLTKLHDELFESAGDMRDSLRNQSTGFAQVIDTVSKKEIPQIKHTSGVDTSKSMTRDTFKHVTKKTLYPLMLNYTQFENFLGWHARERGSSILYNTLKTQIFERDIPDVVAGTATVMLLKGLDKISRRLKFIEEAVGQDADLKGVGKQIGTKLKKGDIEGAYSLFSRQASRIGHLFRFDNLYPGKKLQAFQTEGNLWEKEIYHPIVANYQAENQNFFIGNHLVLNFVEENGMALTAKLIEAIKMHSRMIRQMHTEMQENNIKSPYQTQTMIKMSDYMRSAAQKIANDFMTEHQEYFNSVTPEEREKLKNDVLKETISLQELLCNVSGILATGEAANSVNVAIKEKTIKRNSTLASMAIKKASKPSVEIVSADNLGKG